jgi:Ribbon-helix-helix protein, copG family
MYNAAMKRLQIYIDEDLDDALKFQAMKQRTSKAALIRQYVAERLRPPTRAHDPLDDLVGAYPDVEPGDIDEVVYGR